MKTLFLCLFLSTLLGSCGVRQNDIIGVYTVRNQSNNWDTLRLLSNGTYRRHLRSKQNAFVFSHTDKWRYGSGRLTLYNYVPEGDNALTPDTNLSLTEITSSLPVEKKAGRIVIFHRLETEDFFYEKL
ncbi:hypothetical protein PK28_17375 (plasmid) [Hymenobacter sp. DG25B]|nr:hypothetical protein PK28_17375 [Hymenobacter sp. DG25B]